MYSEKTNNFSIKSVIIQFLFVALFIFILIWLFPMKSDLKNALNGTNQDSNVSVFYDQIFNNNVIAMKEAAKSYFTTERLPQEVGHKVKMTLGEMLEKKIILPFVDSEGKQCDLVDSYVEITKYETEFVMKVNLKCTNQENYLLVYMGCYDYCQTAICEKNKSDISTPIVHPTNSTPQKQPEPQKQLEPEKQPEKEPEKEPEKQPEKEPEKQPEKEPEKEPEKQPEYVYEYVKKIDNSYWKESDWSEYSETPVQADKYTSVRTKITKQKVLIGYNVTTTTDKSKPVYSTKVLNTGTETILVCNKYDYVTTGETVAGTQWTYVGLETHYEKPSKDGYVYEFVRFVDESCSSNCSSTVGRIYKVWKKSTQNLSEYKCVDSSYQTIQHTTEVNYISGYEKTTTKTPVYETRELKTYSYKKREYITSIQEDKKWSTYNDTTLLKNGYEYTGNKKEKTK